MRKKISNIVGNAPYMKIQEIADAIPCNCLLYTSYLTADYAQNDGIHLTVAGYSHWMDYLLSLIHI